MGNSCSHYIKLFKVELEDMIDDIEAYEVIQKDRFERKEITEYVYKENDALFIDEKTCLSYLIKELDKSAYDAISDLEDLIDRIGTDFHAYIQKHNFPEAIEPILYRKMEKARAYLED